MSGEIYSIEQVQQRQHNIRYEDKTIYLKECTIEWVQDREIIYFKYYIHELVDPLPQNLYARTLYNKLFNHIYIFLQGAYSNTILSIYHFGLLEQHNDPSKEIVVDFSIQFPVEDLQLAISTEIEKLFQEEDSTLLYNLIGCPLLYIRKEDPISSNNQMVCIKCNVYRPNVLLCNCGHLYYCSNCVDPTRKLIVCKFCGLHNYVIRVLW